MPFTDPFNDYYKTILVPAIKAAGLEPVRADEIYGTHPIIQDILEGINESTALVADVTGKNPNVNYELGIAHTLSRPVVIISQSVDDIPFDYRHFRAIIYDTKKVNWASDLMSKITNTLLAAAPTFLSVGSSLGVKQVHKDRTEIKFLDCVRDTEAGSEIKLLGIILSDFNNRSIQNALEEKLKAGCKVKMLLLSPSSQFVEIRAREENRDPDEWKDELVAVHRSHKNFISRLPDSIRTNMELGFYDSVPTYSIYMIGDTLIVGFYLRENQGAYLPHLELEVKEHGIYEPFLNHFDSLWRVWEESNSNNAGS
jgi:hypothetical protein